MWSVASTTFPITIYGRRNEEQVGQLGEALGKVEESTGWRQNSQLKRGLEQLDENRSSLITQSEKLREQLDDAYNRLNQVKAIIIQSRLFNHAL